MRGIRFLRSAFGFARLAAFSALLAAGLALAGDGAVDRAAAQDSGDDSGFVTHKLALQVSDDDEAAMRSAFDIAANVSRFYSEQAEEVEIRIIVYGPAMRMLRPEQTPVMDRLTSFSQSMPNVSFAACGNTLDTLEQKEGKRPEIVPFAEVVQAGVVELIKLDEEGYTIVKP